MGGPHKIFCGLSATKILDRVSKRDPLDFSLRPVFGLHVASDFWVNGWVLAEGSRVPELPQQVLKLFGRRNVCRKVWDRRPVKSIEN